MTKVTASMEKASQIPQGTRGTLKPSLLTLAQCHREMVEMQSRVLVVDGCREIRELLTDVLQNRGYAVSTAVDGYDAVLQFDRNKPDMLVTELTIPGMDGYDLCRIIRAISPMPIVVISASRRAEEVFGALKAGVDAFVSKPLDRGKVLAQVEALLSVNSGRAAN